MWALMVTALLCSHQLSPAQQLLREGNDSDSLHRLSLILREKLLSIQCCCLEDDREVYYTAWTWIWVYKPLRSTSLAELNHSWAPVNGEAGIPSCTCYQLNLSASFPCDMSLLIPSSRSRQHNCKHIHHTLASHTSLPHISFYCMAPSFPQNKQWRLNFIQGTGRRTHATKLQVFWQKPENRGMQQTTSQEKDPIGNFLCWCVWCVVYYQKCCCQFWMAFMKWSPSCGCWHTYADCILWDGNGGPNVLCWKRSQDPQSKNGWKTLSSEIMNGFDTGKKSFGHTGLHNKARESLRKGQLFTIWGTLVSLEKW